LTKTSFPAWFFSFHRPFQLLHIDLLAFEDLTKALLHYTRIVSLSKNQITTYHFIMADRGRGSARGGPRGAGGGGFKGRHGGPQGAQPTLEEPKREAILDLSKYVNERIRV